MPGVHEEVLVPGAKMGAPSRPAGRSGWCSNEFVRVVTDELTPNAA